MNGKKAALYAVIAIIALVVIGTLIYVSMGLGEARSESQYTGTVVDVVEDKGVIFRPSWINMKTDSRSSDIQRYCIHPDDEDELLTEFYEAMEDGDRVTVTYSRPLFVSPSECNNDHAIVHDVRPVNGSDQP